MAQPGYGYQPGAVPSAPQLLDPSAEDDVAPPSYEEAVRAPSGGNLNSLSSLARPAGAGDGLLGGRTAYPRADMETGTASSRQTDTTVTDPPPATGGTGDDPPSYQSLFGQIKEAKQSSSGIYDFISKMFLLPMGYLLGLVVVVIIMGLMFGLPLTLISIGVIYLHDCPVSDGIPIWMLVGGVVLTVYILWVSTTGESASGYQATVGAMFFVAWYIAGCVLIYPTWQPAFRPVYNGDTNYCDFTAMMTAFVIINLLTVINGVLFCSSCL